MTSLARRIAAGNVSQLLVPVRQIVTMSNTSADIPVSCADTSPDTVTHSNTNYTHYITHYHARGQYRQNLIGSKPRSSIKDLWRLL